MDFKKQVDKTIHFVQKGVEVAGTLHSAYKIGKMLATAVTQILRSKSMGIHQEGQHVGNHLMGNIRRNVPELGL